MDPVTRDIPEQLAQTSSVGFLIINPEARKVTVHHVDTNGKKHRDQVDLLTVVQGATTEDQAVIRIFLRKMVADCLGMPLADVPEVV